MKPSVFIASSEEALKVAEAIQEHLRATADCQIWTQDAFRPSGGTLDSLLNLVGDHDFGIFVFSPDDKMTIRSKDLVSPRDNVILKLAFLWGDTAVSTSSSSPRKMSLISASRPISGDSRLCRMIQNTQRDFFQELLPPRARFATP